MKVLDWREPPPVPQEWRGKAAALFGELQARPGEWALVASCKDRRGSKRSSATVRAWVRKLRAPVEVTVRDTEVFARWQQ